MSAPAIAVTARCVHCGWRTDIEPGDALQEVRDIHELIHPGGTVLVGPEEAEPKVAPSDPEAPAQNGPVVTSAWTRESAIDAIQAWAAKHGYPPTVLDVAEATRSELPSVSKLKRLFDGSFANAIEAAGFPRPRRGVSRRAASGSSPSSEGPKREAAPPPTPDTSPPPPVDTPAADSAPALVALAQTVEELATRRRAMLADLDAVERELGEAISECAAALDAERLEDLT